MKRSKLKKGQKTSYGHWPAITSPRRKAYYPDGKPYYEVEGKPWREPTPSFFVYDTGNTYLTRRVYHEAGRKFIIVDQYLGRQEVFESIVYTDRVKMFEAIRTDTIVWFCKYVPAAGDTTER